MRVFWEKIGILGPVYRLVGRGWNDKDIAVKLKLTESQVDSCISWILRFLNLSNRMELILDACSTSQRLPQKQLSAQFELLHDCRDALIPVAAPCSGFSAD